MRGRHVHHWSITVLVDDFVPGIPSYVTSCPCGAIRPAPFVEASAVA